MPKPNPEDYLGRNSLIVVYQEPDREPTWHQGAFSRGKPVGVETKYAICFMIANGQALWQPIPDNAQFLAILPHPAKGVKVAVESGEFAGKVGTIVDTAPKTATLVVKLASGETVEVGAADVREVARRKP